jgi:hypothetical protein
MSKLLFASRKAVWVLAFAALVALLAQEANAWGTGGSIQGGFKTVFNDQDLYCDLEDQKSTAEIIATDNPLLFRLGAEPTGDLAKGRVVCWEFTHDGDPIADRQTPKGLFTLIQMRMEGGLEVSDCEQIDTKCDDGGDPPTGDIAKRTTWIFKVESGPLNNENLLWRLKPANPATIDKFCWDQNDHPIHKDHCWANFGLDEHDKATTDSAGKPDGGGNGEKKNDYPKIDMGGVLPMNGLLLGEVFRFTTETTTAGVEQPADLFWGPCHSGLYLSSAHPGCKFGKGPGAKPTKGKGKVKGKK